MPGSLGAQSEHPEDGFGADMVVDFDQHVQMRDGTLLAANVYRPRRDGRYPVIVLRTPYLKTERATVERGRSAVAHGYVFVVIDVRGRGESQGEFVPYRYDGPDGYDAVEWAARQPWSSGKIGTIGKSYDAGVEWLTAIERPPHLAAMISIATVGDPGTDIFITGPTGVPTPTMISWYHLVAGHGIQDLSAIDWSALAWHLPLATMDQASGRSVPYWKEHLQHPGTNAWWDPQRYQTRYQDVQVPVLHVTGWYDDVQGITLRNFTGMTTQDRTPAVRSSQKLIVGPWPHSINSSRRLGAIDFGPSAVIDLEGYGYRWFDYWLKGTPNGIMNEPAVRIFRMAEDVWADEDGMAAQAYTVDADSISTVAGMRIACMATVPCRPGQIMPSSSTATSTIRRTPCPSLRSQPLRNSGGRTTIGRSNAATTSWSTPASPSLLQPWSVVQFRCTSRPRHPRTTRTSWRSCSMCGPMGMLSGSPMAWSAVAFGTGCRNRPCSNQTGSMRTTSISGIRASRSGLATASESRSRRAHFRSTTAT